MIASDVVVSAIAITIAGVVIVITVVMFRDIVVVPVIDRAWVIVSVVLVAVFIAVFRGTVSDQTSGGNSGGGEDGIHALLWTTVSIVTS